MNNAMTQSLDNPVYHQKLKLPRYNGAVNVFQACTEADAAKVLLKLNPTWTGPDHQQLAELNRKEAEKLSISYRELLDAAAQEVYGRPYTFTDYRISAIASEDFTEDKKTALRFAAHAKTNHETVARAHAFAARKAPLH